MDIISFVYFCNNIDYHISNIIIFLFLYPISERNKVRIYIMELHPVTSSSLKVNLFNYKKQNRFSFKGKPWILNYNDVYIRDRNNITSDEAIKLYDKLKLGNYLDIAHPETYPPVNENSHYYKQIRQNNLMFLDRITSPIEKRKFIEYFKNLTMFPNFQKIAERMETEFYNAVKKTENSFCNDYRYTVLAFGYDNTCSVGKKKAFPGSDLDNAYIIINGDNNKIDDEQIINKFKGGIWNNTDQRIVSYNEHAAFPSIYSKRQINGLLDKVNQKTNEMNLHFHKEEPLYSFDIFELGPKKVYPSLFEYYWSLKTNHTEDYVKANEFFINLCKKFTMYNDTEIDISVPSREHIKNFGFFLDTYMNGCYWGERNKDYNLHSRIINSDCAKLANLLQLYSLKQKTAEKYKLSKRQQLEYEFDNWDIDKQFRLVKTIIKASCCDEDDFPEYFSNSNNSFERLINTIRS